LNEGRVLVAEQDGSVVGFATWADADGVTELEDLFVDPDWTRRGMATALVFRTSQQVGPVTGIGQRRTAIHIPYRSKVCEHTWTDHR
jgi:GNAT superfamily N-acetyltransferase